MDGSPAAGEVLHPPQNFSGRYRRVIAGKRVSTRNQMIARHTRDPVQRQIFPLSVQNNLPNLQLGKVALPHGNHIAGPDGGQHAGACHFQANLAPTASHIVDEFAPNSAALCLFIHARQN